MGDKAPVSVIITCHNLEAYLNECVGSVEAQTVKPQEVTIVHDFCDKPLSYAGTTTVIRDYHLGVAKTRDEGVKLSTCPYILFLDADDVLPENYLQEMLAVLETGKADIAYPDVLVWAKWGESKIGNVWHQAPNMITWGKMLHFNQVVMTSLMRREVYTEIGGFDPTLEIYEDWAFWMEALKRSFRFRKAKTFLKYRQRATSRNQQGDEIKKATYQLITNRYREYAKK